MTNNSKTITSLETCQNPNKIYGSDKIDIITPVQFISVYLYNVHQRCTYKYVIGHLMNRISLLIVFISILISCSNNVKIENHINCVKEKVEFKVQNFSNKYFSVNLPESIKWEVKKNRKTYSEISKIFEVSDSTYEGMVPFIKARAEISGLPLDETINKMVKSINTSKTTKLSKQGKIKINNLEYHWIITHHISKTNHKLEGIKFNAKKDSILYSFTILDFEFKKSICKYSPLINSFKIK